MKNKRIIAVLISYIMLFMLAGCGEKGLIASEGELQSYSSQEASSDSEAEASLEEEEIYVDVAGAVQNPGVYRLKQGDRVYQAIEKAGGFREDAEESAINQAAVLEDGQQITVLSTEEQQLQEEKAAEEGLVNINTADEDTLCTLPGIGEAKAKSIIAYREKNGPFKSTEELTQVSGIKEGVFDKVSDLICVN